MEEAETLGPQPVEIVEWKYTEVTVYNGTGRPPELMKDGPLRMRVRCTKCSRPAWMAWRGGDVFDERFFYVIASGVRVYCNRCEGNLVYPWSMVPGFS